MKLKLSLVFNISIVLLVIISCIFMFTGFRFMPDETLLEVTNVAMFKFFTVDSNIFLGIVTLIFLIYEILVIKKKIKVIPNKIYILKLMATTGITLTFITTLLFLSPLYGFYAMYNNSNLFLHLVIPILAITTYILFEKHDTKYKYAFFGIIPMFVYAIYYTVNILVHLNNGGLTFKYDYYGFLQGNIYNAFIVFPIICVITYLLSLLLIFSNKKIKTRS